MSILDSNQITEIFADIQCANFLILVFPGILRIINWNVLNNFFNKLSIQSSKPTFPFQTSLDSLTQKPFQKRMKGPFKNRIKHLARKWDLVFSEYEFERKEICFLNPNSSGMLFLLPSGDLCVVLQNNLSYNGIVKTAHSINSMGLLFLL